jgi:hypothetical protein
MGLKRVEVRFVLVDEDTEAVQCVQKTTWAGLDKQQVLFVEKHLLLSMIGINREAGELLAAAA